jgi:hypothetical protein
MVNQKLKVGTLFIHEDADYYCLIYRINENYFWVNWYGALWHGALSYQDREYKHDELFKYGWKAITDEKEILQYLIKYG